MTAAKIDTPYLTTAEAAEYLRYKSPAAIRTLKMKGFIRPVGRRGGTDVYTRTELDRFMCNLGSGMVDDGRPGIPGKEHGNDGHMDGRLRADQVPGNLQEQDDLRGLSRSRARDRSQDRHAEGGK